MSSLLRNILIASLTALLATSCVTTKEVRDIVTNTNALMAAPEELRYKDTDGADPGTDWREAVQRIDRLITDNPEEGTLVATLRVRQALLLTVYRQDALAREAWKQVDKSKLKTDRDRSFYSLSEPLVWWFSFDGNIDNDEWDDVIGSEAPKESAPGRSSDTSLDNEPIVIQFEMVCDALPVGSDTRLYLEVMRSQIILQVLNDAAVGEERDRQFLAAHAVHSVERLVNAFDSDGQAWLSDNLRGQDLRGSDLMSFLRHLSAARRVINETTSAAEEQHLSITTWRPRWVTTSEPN